MGSKQVLEAGGCRCGARPAPAPLRSPRECGLTLIEVAASLSLFFLLIVSVFLTLARGMEHRQQSLMAYQAISALRDAISQVQDTANQPQNLTTKVGIGSVYIDYNNKVLSVAPLASGQVQVTCYGNETTVPSSLGGPQDLNYDGDPNDNLANASLGTDLKLVPMTFTLTYVSGGATRTVTVDRLVTKTSD